LSAHDVSDGGLAVAVAEMCIASGLGVRLRIDGDVNDVLFAEAMGGYVLECPEVPDGDVTVIGTVEAEPRLVIEHGGRTVADARVDELTEAWRKLSSGW
jgi:phosphoribosylformylglycinamidine synthase